MSLGGRAECVGTSVACQEPGRPFWHFGAATATSPGPQAGLPPQGGRAFLGRHGEVRGILISILG